MILYMVLRLQKNIIFVDPLTKKQVEHEITGCEGFVPVYKTMKEAKRHTAKGKYLIAMVRVGDEQPITKEQK